MVPLADDYEMNMQDWDEFYLQHKDKPLYMGWKARMILTRKLLEQHPAVITENFWTPGGDTRLYRYAWDNGVHLPTRKWFGKVGTTDRTKLDGCYGEWELEDKSILENLVHKEIDIYG